MLRGIVFLVAFLVPFAAAAENLRLAVFNTDLSRKGPGLLFRDIIENKGEDIDAVVSILQHIDPDIVLLLDFDFDAGGLAIGALMDRLRAGDNPANYRHWFARPQNAGLVSDLDLDADGRDREPEDAFGYGRFAGDGAMVLLSKFPIHAQEAEDYAEFLWKDFDKPLLPSHSDGTPFPSADAQAKMRLASKSFWIVPIDLGVRQIKILASHASPPVFDGPEDANGRRNADEVRFWNVYLNNHQPKDFVLLAGLNADPFDGEGAHTILRNLLENPFAQDPEPRSQGGKLASEQGLANQEQEGDPALDTADWNDERGPGNLRVDYVLPATNFEVIASGVFWPTPDDPLYSLVGQTKNAHRLVWVDLKLD